MKQPNADIEWYDDGMTMQEQEQWAKKHKPIKLKLKVTEKQQDEWKATLISKLKTELAANEEYILELKDEIEEWKSKYDTLHDQYIEETVKCKNLWDKWSALNSKYSIDINNYLHSEEFINQYTAKQSAKISELEKKVQRLTDARDTLLYKLLHNDNV
jgi:chromosome segregation ATPase